MLMRLVINSRQLQAAAATFAIRLALAVSTLAFSLSFTLAVASSVLGGGEVISKGKEPGGPEASSLVPPMAMGIAGEAANLQQAGNSAWDAAVLSGQAQADRLMVQPNHLDSSSTEPSTRVNLELAAPIQPLPPASQIDTSVLDALPLQMKREIERAYGKSDQLPAFYKTVLQYIQQGFS